jgi:transposase
MAATIHTTQSTQEFPTLYVALELSSTTWHLAMASGQGAAPRERDLPARDREAFQRELERAKERFGLPATARVLTCYEAGRDGFWIARWLHTLAIENVVVDSASIEVSRRRRRTKSDKVDARSLLRLLMRYAAGDRAVWRVVAVPSVETEDCRHLHRALETLKHDRTRITNRMRGLLATHGVKLGSTLPRDLTQLRCWDGAPLPSGLAARLTREMAHVALIVEQIRSLEREQRAAVRERNDAIVRQVKHLQQLRGIALTSAWVFVAEAFSWRQFRNGRQIGALSGLAPTPYQSGSSHHEQGIGKSGNRRWRTMAIEIAWSWLRFQPSSDLSRWYARRFAQGGPRARRIGAAAVARKLLIALWRYLETGVPPAGAVLKRDAAV